MPRLRYIEDSELTNETRALIESAKRTGAPDPRCVKIYVRNPKVGVAWVNYWNTLLYDGLLPHRLKEMCRIKISVAHNCGYCSTVRSNVAIEEGLTEELVLETMEYQNSDKLSDREKAALHYAELFKQGDGCIDSDDVYDELRQHFSDEEIVELGLFCAEVDGVGKFARSMNIVSWGEACSINPALLDK